ncbi:universal stress protein [Motilimonas eburnea]|uniref:universal stress protein n=1 Tax=Motilimonas eburnea TaxID=1737488 RepID=UPI001E4C2F91|nr:universal stress protein [Motilimonas eburnea]MCE2572876.1 universal stress protein [Motilimonas eburnea]
MSGYRHILVALNLDEDCKPILDKALQRAEIDQATLTLLHVNIQLNQLYTNMISMDLTQLKEQLTERSEMLFDQIMAGVDYPKLNHQVICGDLPESILTAAKELEVDLIIAGHHHDFWGYFHNTAKKILNQAPCDLLIVPV